MTSIIPHSDRHHKIRALFDEYIRLYASRDDRLTTFFSEDFSGYTVGGSVLVTDRNEWVKIIQQDFSKMPGHIHIDIRNISMQDLSDHVVVLNAFLSIRLPFPESVLSREAARLVLIFRLENEAWKIVHSGISVPYHLAQDGEVYPLNNLQERNRLLEALVEERTRELNEREEFYRLLTEETPDVLWRTDSELRITYISPADERLRGYKAEEVVGQHVFELFNMDSVARFGGDEFVVLLGDLVADHAKSIAHAKVVAEKIRVRLSDAYHLNVTREGEAESIIEYRFSASIGVFVFQDREASADDILKYADTAMYQAKAAGRNTIRFYEIDVG